MVSRSLHCMEGGGGELASLSSRERVALGWCCHGGRFWTLTAQSPTGWGGTREVLLASHALVGMEDTC